MGSKNGRTSLGVQWPVFSGADTGDARVPPVLARFNQSAAAFGMSIPS